MLPTSTDGGGRRLTIGGELVGGRIRGPAPAARIRRRDRPADEGRIAGSTQSRPASTVPQRGHEIVRPARYPRRARARSLNRRRTDCARRREARSGCPIGGGASEPAFRTDLAAASRRRRHHRCADCGSERGRSRRRLPERCAAVSAELHSGRVLAAARVTDRGQPSALRPESAQRQPRVRCRSSNRTTTPAGSGGHKQNNEHHTPLAPSFSKSSALVNGGRRVCNADGDLLRPGRPVGRKIAHRFAKLVVVVAAVFGAVCLRRSQRSERRRSGRAPMRPMPGSLRGPFTGRVVDATTKAPIAGALVYAAWTLERGTALTEPAGSREVVGSTDAGGNYKIASSARCPTASRVTDFTLLVYKRGYVAYRSDRRFHDLGPRMDFAQTAQPGAARALAQRALALASPSLRRLGHRGRRAHAVGARRCERRARRQASVGRRSAARSRRRQLRRRRAAAHGHRHQGAHEVRRSVRDRPALRRARHRDVLVAALQGARPAGDVGRRDSRVAPRSRQGDRSATRSCSRSCPASPRRTTSRAARSSANENDIRGVGFLDGTRGVVVLITCGVEPVHVGRGRGRRSRRRVYGKLKQIVPGVSP